LRGFLEIYEIQETAPAMYTKALNAPKVFR
jgi:hypothetical protein